MSRAVRTTVLLMLLALPVVLYVGAGGYLLWESGWLIRLGWVLPAIWGVTWVVSVLWKPTGPQAHLPAPDIPVPNHWTQRDQTAVQIVQKHQGQAISVSVAELTDPHATLQLVLNLATDLAQHYGKPASDPLDGVTVLEVLAASRLALEDTDDWVRQTIPGSQSLTIGHWRMLGKAMPHLQTGVSVVSLMWNPVNFLVSQFTLTPVLNQLQQEALTAVHQRFIRQTGFYLIEMYSGRLQQGADMYRQLFAPYTEGHPVQLQSRQPTSVKEELRPQSLCVAVLGQVKAGKSSLINALLGQRQAQTDTLPLTREIRRYQLPIPETSEQLILLDTPGYAESGASRAQLLEIEQAVRSADLILLVLAANQPAKQADQHLLQQLQHFLQQHPELKAPPVLAVLTQVDLLSPVREWAPPYDWQQGTRPKEQSVRGAIDYVRELFGDQLVDVVPVCCGPDLQKHSGVHEDLLPAMLPHLDAGRNAALLKAYHASLGRGRLTSLLNQLRQSGTTLLTWWIEERLLPNLASPPTGEATADKDRK